MTREEERKYASKDYVNYLLDKQEYHNENYTEYDIQQAFEKGAKWADIHPNTSTFWHDATEMPDTSHDRILVLHKYPDEKPFIWAVDAFSWMVAHNGDWDEYVKASHIISWAYNMDLLPKE